MAYRACMVRMQQSCGSKAATRLRGYEATRVGRTRIQGKEGGQETRCEGSDPRMFNPVMVDWIQTPIQIRFCGGPK